MIYFLAELVSASEMEIKKAISEGVYLDYVVKDGQFYVTFMSTVREDMDKVMNWSWCFTLTHVYYIHYTLILHDIREQYIKSFYVSPWLSLYTIP